ncbi:MAG: Nitrogen regulatory protein [Candidatus Anoxychlamydiales bacterium]|nr:Nitrogen regulatory protein [Candidatus Anoxychlamydiales bacterium]NGX35738.1 Nitrogen regulatory protein [Candidatus Anoxychlamydiales bacterium]
MDLEIKDVSELLNVSEKTIKKWVGEGKMPAYKLENKIRFSRTEIEDWMLNSKMQKEKDSNLINLKSEKAKKLVAKKIGTQAFSLFRALYKGTVINNIKGDTKEEVIKSSVKVIAKNLSLDADVLTDLLLDRENLMPTALNHGVAVPHTRDFLLPKTYDVVSVVYLNKPIEYGSLDGEKVKTLFFLFACDDKRHLHLLAKIAHLTRNEETLNFIHQHPSKTHLLNFIKRWETKLSLEKVSS